MIPACSCAWVNSRSPADGRRPYRLFGYPAPSSSRKSRRCSRSPRSRSRSCASDQRQEIKIVGIFRDLLGEVGLRRRQRGGEVGHGLALPAVQVRLNLQLQDGARPAVLGRLLGVPEALEGVLPFEEQYEVVAPGDLDHRLGQGLAVQFCHGP